MQTVALRNKITTLMSKMPEENLQYLADFAGFMEEKKYGISISELMGYWEEKLREEKEARDKHFIEVVNANADYFNEGAEENLEFQADIWEDEE